PVTSRRARPGTAQERRRDRVQKRPKRPALARGPLDVISVSSTLAAPSGKTYVTNPTPAGSMLLSTSFAASPAELSTSCAPLWTLRGQPPRLGGAAGASHRKPWRAREPGSAAQREHLELRETLARGGAALGVAVVASTPDAADQRVELRVGDATAQRRPKVVADRAEEAGVKLTLGGQPGPGA